MELIEFVIPDSRKNPVRVRFACASTKTRNGFAHTAEMFWGNCQYPEGENRVDYYNRTWEAYPYQTVMRGLVRGLIEETEARQLETWKTALGYERMSPKRRQAFDEWRKCPASTGAARIAFLNRLLDAIETR